MLDKPIYWIGTYKQDIAKFPQNARRKAGFQLREYKVILLQISNQFLS